MSADGKTVQEYADAALRESLRRLAYDHDFERMSCGDADHKRCCPAGCHDVQVSRYEHWADLVTAFLATARPAPVLLAGGDATTWVGGGGAAFGGGASYALPPGSGSGGSAGQGRRDERPHSRACGIYLHDHGSSCARDCPTCRGGRSAIERDVTPVHLFDFLNQGILRTACGGRYTRESDASSTTDPAQVTCPGCVATLPRAVEPTTVDITDPTHAKHMWDAALSGGKGYGSLCGSETGVSVTRWGSVTCPDCRARRNVPQ